MASSRLYPGNNRLHGPFEAVYRCYSVACLGKPELEFGDKVILPSEAFKQVSLLKLKLPLLFRIRNSQRRELPPFEQYCGVLEFSAPEGQVYLPYWMMQNLLVQEGGRVDLRSMPQPEKGTFCRFMPHAADFLDLAAQLGPRSLMENAMRQYSLLSKGETICVEYGGQRYYLEVIDVKPGEVVSLLGNLDLEVDFTLPKSKDVGKSLDRPRTGSRISQFMDDGDDAPAPRVNSWMHQRADSNKSSKREPLEEKTPPKQTRADSRARAESRTKERPLGLPLGGKKGKFATKSKVAWGAFKSEGRAVAEDSKDSSTADSDHQAPRSLNSPGLTSQDAKKGIPPVARQAPVLGDGGKQEDKDVDSESCPTCGALIPRVNFDLHTLRCAKNDRYHKIPCPNCKLMIQKSDLQDHIDQLHMIVTCKLCAESMEKEQLPNHTKLECLNRLEPCQFCELSFPFKNLVEHIDKCGVRTEQCLECKHYIKLRDCQDHTISGECARFILEDAEKEQKKKEREEAVRKQLENFAASGAGANDINGFEAIDSVEGLLLQARRAQLESALLLKATKEKNDNMLNRNTNGDANRGGNLITPDGAVSRKHAEMNRKMYKEIEENASVLAAMAQNLNTGDFAMSNYLNEPSTVVDCSKCGQKCDDYEDLQIHMLTSCPLRPSAMAEQKLSAQATESGSPSKRHPTAVRPKSKDSVSSLHSNMSARMSFQKWNCEACTFENDADESDCEVCGSPKPAQRSSGSRQRKTSSCSTFKPAVPPSGSVPIKHRVSPIISPGHDRRRPLSGNRGVMESKSSRGPGGTNWTCESCTFDNDFNSEECEVCENPRPSTTGSLGVRGNLSKNRASISSNPSSARGSGRSLANQPNPKNPRIRSRRLLEESTSQPKSWQSTRPPGKAPVKQKPTSIRGSTKPTNERVAKRPPEKLDSACQQAAGMGISGSKITTSQQASTQRKPSGQASAPKPQASTSAAVERERKKRPVEGSRRPSGSQNKVAAGKTGARNRANNIPKEQQKVTRIRKNSTDKNRNVNPRTRPTGR